MRHIVCIATALSLLTSCTQPQANTPSEASGCGKAEIEKWQVDLGQIGYGDIVGVKYKIKNVGTAPLTIADVETTCGCTQANYKAQPIEAGSNANIEIVFDTSGLHGYQYKTATVIANTSCATERIKIAFTAQIE